jgi:hypothetical protein
VLDASAVGWPTFALFAKVGVGWRVEKLCSMHRNPMKLVLVTELEQ